MKKIYYVVWQIYDDDSNVYKSAIVGDTFYTNYDRAIEKFEQHLLKVGSMDGAARSWREPGSYLAT